MINIENNGVIKINNPRDLSEIQKMRELEAKGETKEQLAYVLKVLESKDEEMKDISAELTLISTAQFVGLTKAVAELTEMVTMMHVQG